MRILALSDRVVDAIYSPQACDLYGDVDLVIGCGDLPYYYLEYVVTMLRAPVMYVYGNHDNVQYMSDGRRVLEPEGCISLEGKAVEYRGLLLAGLGGSMRYQPRAVHQYSEAEMRMRVAALIPQLVLNRARHGRYLDVLVAHSPPFGIHDREDLTHTGFKAFLTLMRYAKPRYLLHGHTHLYRRDGVSQTQYGTTQVVNVYPNRVIELELNE
jgi:Icc-related predicted phosphoesterase